MDIIVRRSSFEVLSIVSKTTERKQWQNNDGKVWITQIEFELKYKLAPRINTNCKQLIVEADAVTEEESIRIAWGKVLSTSYNELLELDQSKLVICYNDERINSGNYH